MKLKVIPIQTWNPTKIFSYEECPLRTQLRYALKLCPHCFKGHFGYDAACDHCGLFNKKSEAQLRGIRLDEQIAVHIRGGALDEPIPHPKVKMAVRGIVKDFAAVAKGSVEVYLKHSISLSATWEPLPKFTKAPWFWGELDVLKISKKVADVIDWKTGGIDKKTGAVRPKGDYEDQLEIYGVAVLCSRPTVGEVHPSLVFLDARPPHDPVVQRPPILRRMLEKLKKRWEGRIKPMLSDDTFAPRPGTPYCGWCDYSKQKGGPCPY